MNCLSDNVLQMLLDGELSDEKAEEAMAHMACCEPCQLRYECMKEINVFSATHLSESSVMAAFKASAPTSLNPIHLDERKLEIGGLGHMKKIQKWMVTAAAVMVLVVGLTTPSVKAAVTDVVAIFRADNIQTVDVSLASLKQLEEALDKKEGAIDIKDLAKVTDSGFEDKTVTLEEAKDWVSFQIKPLVGLPNEATNTVVVRTKGQIDFTLNIPKVNELMKTLGATTLFDPALDGKTFSILHKGEVDISYNLSEERFLHYSQTTAPEINAPAGTDMKQLVNAIASMGILPYELQNQLKHLNNMDNTLYIPNVDGQLKEKQIGNKKVYYSERKEGEASYSDAIWIEAGVMRSISGNLPFSELEKILLNN